VYISLSYKNLFNTSPREKSGNNCNSELESIKNNSKLTVNKQTGKKNTLEVRKTLFGIRYCFGISVKSTVFIIKQYPQPSDSVKIGANLLRWENTVVEHTRMGNVGFNPKP
jgi:hypothetical protein